MSKKRSIRKAQAKRAPEAPRLIQQISFSGTYNAENDSIESFSCAPPNVNPLLLQRALHVLDSQLMAAVLKERETIRSTAAENGT